MVFLRKRPKPARIAEDSAGEAADKVESGALAPSPNPATNLLLADIALRGGGALLKRAVETGLLGLGAATAGKGMTKGKAKAVVKGRSLGQSLFGTMLARLATRSVPGALLVGGGLLAKTLYDRKRGRSAGEQGHDQLDQQARKGRR